MKSNDGKEKILALIASLCFAITGWYIIKDIVRSGADTITIRTVMALIYLWGMSGLLFFEKKNVGLIFLTGCKVSNEILNVCHAYFDYRDICFLLGSFLFFIMTLLCVVKNKRTPLIIILDIMAVIVFAIGYISYVFRFNVYEVQVIAMLFSGLWLYSTAKIEYVAPLINGADRIKIYKDLLDSGAITQEEFEKKKKEALEI